MTICSYFPMVSFCCTIISLGLQWDLVVTNCPPFDSWKHTLIRERFQNGSSHSPGSSEPCSFGLTDSENSTTWKGDFLRPHNPSPAREDLINPQNILSGLTGLKRWPSPILTHSLSWAERGTPPPPPPASPICLSHLSEEKNGLGGCGRFKSEQTNVWKTTPSIKEHLKRDPGD